MHLAVQNEHLKIVEFLVNSGGDINSKGAGVS